MELLFRRAAQAAVHGMCSVLNSLCYSVHTQPMVWI